MAEIDVKNLQTVVKSFARANALPLEKDEVWESLSAAQAYMTSPTAYAGQSIKVLMNNGEYKLFILQRNGNALEMREPSVSVDESTLTQWVQIVNELPQETPTQGVIYILTTDNSGHIWNGTGYTQIFGEVSIDLSNFAKLDGAQFTGEVLLAADPVEALGAATKQYVDRIASGGIDYTEAIAQAKQEAIDESKQYTENILVMTEF